MSAESLRARLAAATPGPWEGLLVGVVGDEERTYVAPFDNERQAPKPADADLIAHAPTDLALLLAVFDAAKEAIDPGDYLPQHFTYPGDVTCADCFESWPCATERTRLAIAAFEAAP